MPGKLKIIGAILIALCFVLPIKSCTQCMDKTEKPDTPCVNSVTEHFYLLGELEKNDPVSWLRVVSFIFPAAIVLYTRRRPAARLTRVLWFLEPVLLAWLVLDGWGSVYMYRPDIGTYVGGLGVAVYFVAWVIEAYRKFRGWRQGRLAVSRS